MSAVFNKRLNKPFDIIVVIDDYIRSETLYEYFDDPDFPTIDQEALYSLAFSFINEVLNEGVNPNDVVDWIFYEIAPVIEEDNKVRLSEKILTLKDLFREFLLAWISKLKEDGFIQNEYFAYDFAGLHRDGSFVFRRQKSID